MNMVEKLDKLIERYETHVSYSKEMYLKNKSILSERECGYLRNIHKIYERLVEDLKQLKEA